MLGGLSQPYLADRPQSSNTREVLTVGVCKSVSAVLFHNNHQPPFHWDSKKSVAVSSIQGLEQMSGKKCCLFRV